MTIEKCERFFIRSDNLANFYVIHSCYLGGFIGEPCACDSWILEKTASWRTGVLALAGFAGDCPQAAYSGLQQSLQ